jgi:Tfp pilus assembly protein PilP
MTRTLALGALVMLGVASHGAAPMAGQAPPQAARVEGAPAAAQTPGPVEKDDARVPALPPQGFTYTAEGRRDPFVTLVTRGSETTTTTAAGRAAGLAGLHTGEVALRGILASEGSYVAMLLGADEKTYIVRTGDRLADGTIAAIHADALVIEQLVTDPLARQKRREVRKTLRQVDGTN